MTNWPSSIFLQAAVLVAAIIAATSPVVASASGHRALVDLEHDVARDYPGAASLLPEQFEKMLDDDAPILVLDARDQNEFAVSHIPGARRVSPNISVARFMDQFVNGALVRAGSRGAVNLRGGIFAWHNTGRQLKTTDAPTDFVHPFDDRWSRYVDFDNYTRTER